MTDLFRGYDLTTVAEAVARKQYDRIKYAAEHQYPDEPDGSRAKGNPVLTEWEDISPIEKRNFKEGLLSIITDVLEALESDQVKPSEGKQMVLYKFAAADRSDPRWYENQDHQHNISTASVWVLHLHVTADEDVRDAILERMSVLPETTGEYTFGDSWRQWCELSENEGDVRLAIYFHATPDRASSVGQHLATHAAFAGRPKGYSDALFDFGVSTSGDYAEQVVV